MAKRKGLTYEEKLKNALEKLPTPIEDKRHGIIIVFENDRARSNQSRFDHIVLPRHELKPSDIKRIPRYIKTCIFKKDPERTDTFSIYIHRKNHDKEYIKISVSINPNEPKIAVVKTMFITKILK